MSGDRRVLSLVASTASQAPESWYTADGSPDEQADDATDEVSAAERILFPGAFRCSLRQEPIRCDLTQVQNSQRRRVPILGTAMARLSSHAGVVALRSCSVSVDDATPEGSWRWSDLAADSGRVITNRKFDLDADQFVRELSSPEPLTPSSLDLPRLVEQVGSGRLEGKAVATGLPVGPEQQLLAVVEDLPVAEDVASVDDVDVLLVEDSESGKRHRTLLRVRRRQPGSADIGILQAEIDLVTAHQWLLRASEEVLRRLFNLVHRMEQMTPGARQRALRQFWAVRAASVRWLEGAWLLDVRATQPGSAIPALDGALGLSARWHGQIVRLQDATQTVDGLASVPARREVPERPPDPEESPFLAVGIRKKAREVIEILRGHGAKERRTREVELHPFANRDALFADIGTSLTVTTLMTATAGILLGIVLERGSPLREPVDILLLFVSTFAFFFSTLVLNRAARRLARQTTWGVETDINRASAMSEYLGHYTFIAALPLLVVRFIGPVESLPGGSGSAGRTLVTWTVSILAWVMLLGYHRIEGAGFFNADFGGRSFLTDRQKHGLTAIIAVDTALLLFTPLIHGVPSWIQWAAALVLVALLIILVVAAWALSEVVDDHHYKVDVWDAMGAEEASFTDPDWRRGS